ncbi:MAG: hypothetical protein JSV84_14775 [Gemmatimonadota bacterium]|nr:MAG: hypothetical protein JSV84_14775 [Gemmatimonadota bacterium]
MKKRTKMILLIGFASLLVGCEEERRCFRPDYTPPAVPRGVTSVTGNWEVYISWYPNNDQDLAGYNVYVGSEPEGYYTLIASTPSANFVDRDVLNGETYYYAVSAYDYSGNESELSFDLVFDTPRPEGWGARLWDLHIFPNDAGYDFSSQLVLPYTDSRADIFFEIDKGIPFMWRATVNTDIQDFGYTTSIDDVDYAPEFGWILMDWLELVAGHTYIVWTEDNHFAKFRVIQVGSNFLTFDWAYQVDPGNPELKLVRERIQKRNSELSESESVR